MYFRKVSQNTLISKYLIYIFSYNYALLRLNYILFREFMHVVLYDYSCGYYVF